MKYSKDSKYECVEYGVRCPEMGFEDETYFNYHLFGDMNSSTDIGNLSKVEKIDGVDVQLAVVDSSFDGNAKPIIALGSIDQIDSNTPWVMEYFDPNHGDTWIHVSRWIDFIDLDGDNHHGKIHRYFNPENPKEVDYLLEIDLLSEQ